MSNDFRLPDPPQQYDASYMRKMVRQVELAVKGLQPANSLQYTLANFTVTRQIDLSTATQTDINNFFATLADDLRRAGMLP